MAKVKTEIEQTGQEPKSEWVHPEAQEIFNALLKAFPYAQNAGWRAQFWRSAMLSLGELYPADKPRVVEFFLNQEGLNQPTKEMPAKPAKAASEYRKEPDYSAQAGLETSGKCESCG